MAPKFRIFSHRNSENVHLKLSGDFDDTSAWELINALIKYSGLAKNIYIHTASLSFVHPFGRRPFEKTAISKNYPFL